MPGVYRPTTLIDVLATLNDGLLPPIDSTTQSQTTIFGEIDETLVMDDSMATTVAAPETWDSGVWGGTGWS